MVYLLWVLLAVYLLCRAGQEQNRALEALGLQAVLFERKTQATYDLGPLTMLGGREMGVGVACAKIPLENVEREKTAASISVQGREFRLCAVEGNVRVTRWGNQFVLNPGKEEKLWNLDRLEIFGKHDQPVADFVFCCGTTVPYEIRKEAQRQVDRELEKNAMWLDLEEQNKEKETM